MVCKAGWVTGVGPVLIVALSCTGVPRAGWMDSNSNERIDLLPGVSVLRPPSRGNCDHRAPDRVNSVIAYCGWGDESGLWEASISARQLDGRVANLPFPEVFDLANFNFNFEPERHEVFRLPDGATCARKSFFAEGMSGVSQVCVFGCLAIYVREVVDSRKMPRHDGRFIGSLNLRAPEGVGFESWGCTSD